MSMVGLQRNPKLNQNKIQYNLDKSRKIDVIRQIKSQFFNVRKKYAHTSHIVCCRRYFYKHNFNEIGRFHACLTYLTFIYIIVCLSAWLLDCLPACIYVYVCICVRVCVCVRHCVVSADLKISVFII